MGRQITLDGDTQATFASIASDSGSTFLLLGAGASRALGMPTMNEFFRPLFGGDFEELLGTPAHPDRAEGALIRGEPREMVAALVWAAYPKRPDTGVFDLETVMDLIVWLRRLRDEGDLQKLVACAELLERGGRLGRYSDWIGKVGQRIDKADRIVFDRVGKAYEWLAGEFYRVFGPIPPEKAQAAHDMWRPLLEASAAAGTTRLPVFTTNYDLTFEQLLGPDAASKWELLTGFEFDTSVGAEVWDIANYAKESPRQQVLLYKMHGSSNWHCIGEKLYYQGHGNAHQPGPDPMPYPHLSLGRGGSRGPYSAVWSARATAL